MIERTRAAGNNRAREHQASQGDEEAAASEMGGKWRGQLF